MRWVVPKDTSGPAVHLQTSQHILYLKSSEYERCLPPQLTGGQNVGHHQRNKGGAM